jgi:hypothetical protein
MAGHQGLVVLDQVNRDCRVAADRLRGAGHSLQDVANVQRAGDLAGQPQDLALRVTAASQLGLPARREVTSLRQRRGHLVEPLRRSAQILRPAGFHPVGKGATRELRHRVQELTQRLAHQRVQPSEPRAKHDQGRHDEPGLRGRGTQ